jgi:hypothetical protein
MTSNVLTESPLHKATHMFFAIDQQGRVYAAGWDVPEWNTKRDFFKRRKEHRNSVIKRLHRDSEECKALIARFRDEPYP